MTQFDPTVDTLGSAATMKSVRHVLHNLPAEFTLKSLTDIMKSASAASPPNTEYEPMDFPFCDGIEYCLGTVSTSLVKLLLGDLSSEIALQVISVKVQNMLLRRRSFKTFLWMTVTQDTARLNSALLRAIEDIRRTMDLFFTRRLPISTAAQALVTVTKVDFTRDFKGSFLPKDDSSLYD